MLRSRYCLCVLCAAVALALAAVFLAAPPSATAQDKPADAKKKLSFIDDIAPIFKENCFACHDGKKKKGGLDMTTYEAMRKPGNTFEDCITDKNPAESGLVERLKLAKAHAKRMPPPKESPEPLPKEKIALIEQWITEGAECDVDKKGDLLKELRARWKPPAPPAVYPRPALVNSLAFTPDNAKVVVSGHHELTVWNVESAKLEKRIYTRAERAYAMLFLPDGKLAVAGGRPGQEGDVCIYDIDGGKPADVGGVAVSDGVNDKAVLLSRLVATEDSILCLTASADGKKLAAGGCDRLVRVWDLSGGYAAAKMDTPIENHADWVLAVALAPDGKHLFTSSRDKTAKVYDLTTRESVQTFGDHQQPVYGVAVKGDGKLGYSVGEDGQLRTWNVIIDGKGEGKQVRNVGAHGKAALKLVMNPKQPLLGTCGADNTAKVWNADSGAAVATLGGHTDQVFAVAFSPDGTLVASGSYNGEVKLWKLADPKMPLKAFNATPGAEK